MPGAMDVFGVDRAALRTGDDPLPCGRANAAGLPKRPWWPGGRHRPHARDAHTVGLTTDGDANAPVPRRWTITAGDGWGQLFSSLAPWRAPRLADWRLSPPLRPISAMCSRSRLTASPPF